MNSTASPAATVATPNAPVAPIAPASSSGPIDFRSRDFLLSHVRDTLAFYAPTARDPSGGFFHFFKDDGRIYDRTTRHLVISTRFVFNYAMAYRHFGDAAYQDDARHAFKFLRDAH
jgi:mannose/cellobiose epimerase-like protein (N-acyl-D-glucosamine 2-epimerase family)